MTPLEVGSYIFYAGIALIAVGIIGLCVLFAVLFIIAHL